MTRDEWINTAKARMRIGMNPKHPDWFEGMYDEAQDELHQALSLPLDHDGELYPPRMPQKQVSKRRAADRY